jgi:hypothetical protein
VVQIQLKQPQNKNPKLLTAQKNQWQTASLLQVHSEPKQMENIHPQTTTATGHTKFYTHQHSQDPHEYAQTQQNPPLQPQRSVPVLADHSLQKSTLSPKDPKRCLNPD